MYSRPPQLVTGGLELVFATGDGPSPAGVYLATRPSLAEPFGAPVHVDLPASAGVPTGVALLDDGRTLLTVRPDLPPFGHAFRRARAEAGLADFSEDLGPLLPHPQLFYNCLLPKTLGHSLLSNL